MTRRIFSLAALLFAVTAVTPPPDSGPHDRVHAAAPAAVDNASSRSVSQVESLVLEFFAVQALGAQVSAADSSQATPFRESWAVKYSLYLVGTVAMAVIIMSALMLRSDRPSESPFTGYGGSEQNTGARRQHSSFAT